jgi:hypothetical protein
MDQPEQSRTSSFFAWLNGLPDWQFTATLYLLRWAIIWPLALVLSPLATSADEFHGEGDPWGYLIPFLVLAPTLETFIECAAPYWVMYRVLKWPRRSPWPFVVVSGTVMVLFHPLTPVVMAFAFVTGSFLAYVYVHFAPQSQIKAFLHTAVFHAAINVVGWTAILIHSMT